MRFAVNEFASYAGSGPVHGFPLRSTAVKSYKATNIAVEMKSSSFAIYSLVSRHDQMKKKKHFRHECLLSCPLRLMLVLRFAVQLKIRGSYNMGANRSPSQ